MYIDDNIQIDITFLLIGVTLFERGKKDKKNTLCFPYKLILKRFVFFFFFYIQALRLDFFLLNSFKYNVYGKYIFYQRT
jgi:hypothetical protein